MHGTDKNKMVRIFCLTSERVEQVPSPFSESPRVESAGKLTARFSIHRASITFMIDTCWEESVAVNFPVGSTRGDIKRTGYGTGLALTQIMVPGIFFF